MDVTRTDRGTWGSKLAFILAAAGSAIGLGNIWRFPTTVGMNGGAAFVIIYLACVLLLGLPIMLAELSLGRNTEKNPVGAFARIAPGTPWHWVGMLGVLTGIAILSYYSVIAGWTVGYVFKAFAGEFNQIATPEAIEASYNALISNPAAAVGLHALFMVMTILVVAGGIRAGIERWTKILMPALFLILALLVIRSITLPGAMAGLEFYLRPDFSKVTIGTVMNALGQAFFSLSLGMGAMITYGSYLSKRESLFSAGVWVSLADTGIALLAGLAIFPALFTISGLEPTEGPGLIFVVLPNIFDKIPGGTIFGAGFFVLLTIAALTSSISLLEVVVAYFIDEKGWSRRQAVIVLGATAFLLGVPSALASGAVSWLEELPLVGVSFLGLMDTAFGNFSLALGAMLLALFVGWRWGMRSATAEIYRERRPGILAAVWSLLLCYVCPVAIAIIIVRLVISSFGL